MSDLSKIYSYLESIINMLTLSHDVEAAVIDRNCNLVASSEKYLNLKGKDVHKHAVEQAFKAGGLVISKPGFMESCKGCRFQFDCPSTVELVQSIGSRAKPLGIISVTSFNQREDHNFSGQLEQYKNALSHASALVESILKISDNKISILNSRGKNSNRIVGNSKCILELKEKVNKIAKTSTNILITGETGTGKELFAQTIHAKGPRAKFGFIPVNCAAIPDNLLESELFGYESGSFTGALKQGKPGLFEQAHKGTLFLDEIGDMSSNLQAKLLRVLQDKKVKRIGGSKFFNADVRIISATNRDLKQMIEHSLFRLDLFYRISVVPLHIPPLRERKEDIELLAAYFLDKFINDMNFAPVSFSKEAMALLKNHIWEGNARELENAVEYALNMCEQKQITNASLPDTVKLSQKGNPVKKSDSAKSVLPYKLAVKVHEKELLISVLNETGFDLEGKKAAAKKLGIGLRTLYRKLEKLDKSNKNE